MTIPVPLLSAKPKKAMPPQHWADLSHQKQHEAAQQRNLPAFRVKQINKQYFQRLQENPHTMTDVPRHLRETMTAELFPPLLTRVQTYTVDGGDTTKILWRLHDNSLVENVIMYYADRVTLCVSSQAGCAMACPFCATGQGGLERNLSAAEIIEQVRQAAKQVHDDSAGTRRLSNIVFMGMGEPLANYARVVHTLRAITSPDAFGISARSVTVSTVGLVPAIYKLIKENIPVTLAVSLHAPDDELRDTLVPINQRWKVEEVCEAMYEYAAHTGRRVSIEYALIKQINDHKWRGQLLGSLLREKLGSLAHVNVIPLNPTPGSQWDASEPQVMKEFVTAVRDAGVSCTVRDTRGQEIAAACGQLAAQEH